jgi:hypothetical protein
MEDAAMHTKYHISVAAILLLCLSLISPGFAQRVAKKRIHYGTRTEITPIYGAQFLGRMPAKEGDMRVRESQTFGLIVDVPVNYDVYVEFSYSRQPTSLGFNYATSDVALERPDELKVNVDYWQLGALREVKYPGYKVFGAVTLGAASFAPRDSEYQTEWLFSLAGSAGLKYYFSEKLGIRFTGRLMLPMKFGGGELWCGPTGCSVDTGEQARMVQADATIGFIIRFGHDYARRNKARQ